MYRYAVVVVTYNRKQLLKECLGQLYRQSIAFSQIIVIDNCSTDGTGAFLEEQKAHHPELTVCHMDTNLGGAGGFCRGLARVAEDMDYVLIIDDDAMIALDFLEKIQEAMTPDVLAYSGTVMTDGKIDLTHRRRLFSSIFMMKKDVPAGEYEKPFFSYDLATFCGLLVQNALLRKLGLPKEEYFIWFDDTEYSLRIRKHSEIWNVNGAVLQHKTIVPAGKKRMGWKNYYGYRNQWDMGRIHSKAPVLHELYRYVYHWQYIVRFWILEKKNPSEREYYKKVQKLHRDVIRDSRAHKLGRSGEYAPGSF